MGGVYVGVRHIMSVEISQYISFLCLFMWYFFPSQSVTGAKFVDDVNSYWVVRGPHREQCSRGLVT